MRQLTEQSYWKDVYGRRHRRAALEITGFRNHFTRLILGKLTAVGMNDKRILEVGAGDSVWLPYLAKRFPTSRFCGLDYSAEGCELLAERARKDQVPMEVIHEDVFVERSQWHGQFDVVYSFGVVEHFEDLSKVLATMRDYLKPGGVLVTFIPNLSGVLGTLARYWNKDVYDKHVPHDWSSFQDGHRRANLRIESGGYLGSTNFGTISSCFTKQSGLSWHTYVFLTRLSKAVWLFENTVCSLPATRTFSPYIYAVSR